MIDETIKMELSSNGIDDAMKQLDKYTKDFSKKVDVFRAKVAEEIADLARTNFVNSSSDDWLKGTAPKPEVRITVHDEGNVSMVVAEGKDAVFIEFGAGVYHNGSAGSSPHPMASENTVIGGYGKGMGKNKQWGYVDAGGQLHVTHGTKSTMPLYRASQMIADRVVVIAQEVFG